MIQNLKTTIENLEINGGAEVDLKELRNKIAQLEIDFDKWTNCFDCDMDSEKLKRRSNAAIMSKPQSISIDQGLTVLMDRANRIITVLSSDQPVAILVMNQLDVVMANVAVYSQKQDISMLDWPSGLYKIQILGEDISDLSKTLVIYND